MFRARAQLVSALLFACLPLLYARPAAAGIARFTAFGPPNGRILTAAALPGQPARLLLSTELGGVFRSADGGHTWAWSGVGLAGDPLRAILPDPYHPGALYGASLTAFYRSENLGQSWTAVATGQRFGFDTAEAEVRLAIAPGQRGQDPVLYLTAGQQLFVSHDLGVTWPASRTEAFGVAFTALAIDPQHPKTTAYAATAALGSHQTGGLLRSTDTGYLWSRLPLPAAFAQGVFGFAIVPTSPPVYLATNAEGRLFRSTTGGVSWREVRGQGIGFGSLEVDPASPGTVYSLGGGILRVSADAGATWRLLGDPLPTGDGIPTLALGAAKGRAGGTLYAVTSFDVYAGAPRFAHWSFAFHSAFETTADRGVAGRVRFDPTDPTTVYVALGERVYRSTDSGVSWASFAIDPALPIGITDLVLTPGDPDRILVATLVYGLFESPNRGQTWAPIGPPDLALRELTPLDSHTLLGDDGGGLLRSTDGGASWAQTLDLPVLKLLPDPTNPDVVYAVEFESDYNVFPPVMHPFVVKSTDRGATWRTILDRGTSVTLDPAHPAILYALQDGDLLKTTDGGATWLRVGAYPDPDAKLLFDTDLLVDPRAASTLYGTSLQQGVLRSTDGGVTWAPALLTPIPGNVGAPGTFLQRLYADPFVPHRIYAAVSRRLYVANF